MINNSISSLLIIIMLFASCDKARNPKLYAVPTVHVVEVIKLDVNHQDVFQIGRFGFPENNNDHTARLGDGMITGELWGNSFWISTENPGRITKYGAETFAKHDEASEEELINKIKSLVPGLGPNARVLAARCGKNLVILRRNQFGHDAALIIENKFDGFAHVNFDHISDENVERIITYLGGLRIYEE
jgi:hypothetical protein